MQKHLIIVLFINKILFTAYFPTVVIFLKE